MGYRVELLNFEGPLDLLLQLIEQTELEVTQVSLAQVTDQYLAYLRELPRLDPQEINWFTLLAAKLLLIKSQALLPAGQAAEEESEDAQALQHQLEQYRRFHAAANWLGQQLASDQFSMGRTPQPRAAEAPAAELPLGLSPRELHQAWQRVQTRFAQSEAQPKLVLDQLTAEEMIRRVVGRLIQISPQSLDELAQSAQNREELVLLFLAVLELSRQGRVNLTQAAQFDTIVVNHDTG